MNSFAQMREQSNRTEADFLQIELDTAFTFLQTAEITRLEETRLRNYNNARTAYETVVRLCARVTLPLEERSMFETRLADLRSRLQELGVVPSGAEAPHPPPQG
jgi:hypothetical protein